MSILWDPSEQGSPEWMAARRGRITGSRAKDARDRSNGLTKQQTAYVGAIRDGRTEAEAMRIAGYKAAPRSDDVAKAIAGMLPMVWAPGAIRYAMDLARQREEGKTLMFRYENAAMREGKTEEPMARRAYMLRSGLLVEQVGFAYTDDGKFGVSPDGLVDDEDDGAVEIKVMVSSETLFTAFIDGDISDYRDQCLMEMWLLHKRWCDLALWAPDMPVPLRVIRIERDEDEIQRLVDDLMDFDAMVESYRAKLRARMAEMAEDPIVGLDMPSDLIEAAAADVIRAEMPPAQPAEPPAQAAPAVVIVKPGEVPADIF